MKIKTGISQRHIHITEEDYNLLFEEALQEERKLNQPGQYAAKQKVTLEKDGKTIENVRIIGPHRSYTQVEISKTDAYKLKINPPVKDSGDLKDAEEINIIGPVGKIKRKAVIIANRHIHITKEERKLYNLTKDAYEIKVKGEKGGIYSNVIIKEDPNSYFEFHIDTDDANAFDLKQNDEVEIIIK